MDSCSRNRLLALLPHAVAALLCGACSDTVRLAQETESGGVVTYLFKDDRGGPIGSPHRSEALKVLDQKCPDGYTVVRDGEVNEYASLSSTEAQEGEVAGRRWGIQFHCK
ncbi:MAG: hypothetical protein HY038_08995 [Nitrospirae bacterium]|nr:hypothetical protein [Nitrospirota bacterium]